MIVSIKKILKTSIPLIFGAVLVWYSLSKISINVLIGYFKEANYEWIFLGLFFGILSHLSRAYRWKFMLDPLGFKPRFTNSVLAVLVGYLVNLAIPRAGEVSRAFVLTNYEQIPFEKGFGTIVAERIADLVMMLCIIIITLFVQFDFIYDLLTKNFDASKISIGLIILTIICYILYFFVILYWIVYILYFGSVLQQSIAVLVTFGISIIKCIYAITQTGDFRFLFYHLYSFIYFLAKAKSFNFKAVAKPFLSKVVSSTSSFFMSCVF